MIDRLKQIAGRFVQLVLVATLALQALVCGCDGEAKWKGISTDSDRNSDGATVRDASTGGGADGRSP
jgi:hypothetical protein